MSIPSLDHRWSIVEVLQTIEMQVPLLSFLDPVNTLEQKELFFSEKRKEPFFEYMPLSESINTLPTLDSDDPLALLYKKRIELTEKKVNLIRARGDDTQFSALSQELYPVRSLKSILDRNDLFDVEEEDKTITAADLMRIFEDELQQAKFDRWTVAIIPVMASRIRIDDKSHTIFIRDGTQFGSEETERLVRHEIGVHILRREHGRMQTEPLLFIGTAGGEMIEEGIAIAAEGSLRSSRIYLRHSAVLFAQDHSFRETFDYLKHTFNISSEEAWVTVLRVKRGLSDGVSSGAFTKDALYSQGFEDVQEYLRNGGETSLLLSARIHPNDLPILKQCNSIETIENPLMPVLY